MNKIFSRLLEWTQEGVYQYTFEDGKLLYANRGLAKILDLDLEPDEIIGKKYQIWLNIHRSLELYEKLLQNRDSCMDSSIISRH